MRARSDLRLENIRRHGNVQYTSMLRNIDNKAQRYVLLNALRGGPGTGVLEVDTALGDEGTLGFAGPSLLMISWIDASSASTRLDICITVYGIRLGIMAMRSTARTAVEDLRRHVVELSVQVLEQRFDL